MKKTFELTHPKIKVARLFDSVKHDVKKYIKRERKKTLPEDTDFWDFECKYGHTEEQAQVVHLSEINKHIDEAQKLELTSFYIEIIAKPATRSHKMPIDEALDEDEVEDEFDKDE